MTNSATLTFEGSEQLLEMLGKLPTLVIASGGPMDRAVSKASAIVADRARQLAPNSDRTGSRKKQSKKTKAIWTGKLNRLVRVKLIRYETATWSVVGPKSREGNMSHFQQEKPRRHVLWGRATRVAQYRIERNWINQAFDETKQQQMQAMEQSIKRDIDQMMGAN